MSLVQKLSTDRGNFQVPTDYSSVVSAGLVSVSNAALVITILQFDDAQDRDFLLFVYTLTLVARGVWRAASGEPGLIGLSPKRSRFGLVYKLLAATALVTGVPLAVLGLDASTSTVVLAAVVPLCLLPYDHLRFEEYALDGYTAVLRADSQMLFGSLAGLLAVVSFGQLGLLVWCAGMISGVALLLRGGPTVKPTRKEAVGLPTSRFILEFLALMGASQLALLVVDSFQDEQAIVNLRQGLLLMSPLSVGIVGVRPLIHRRIARGLLDSGVYRLLGAFCLVLWGVSGAAFLLVRRASDAWAFADSLVPETSAFWVASAMVWLSVAQTALSLTGRKSGAPRSWYLRLISVASLLGLAAAFVSSRGGFQLRGLVIFSVVQASAVLIGAINGFDNEIA